VQDDFVAADVYLIRAIVKLKATAVTNDYLWRVQFRVRGSFNPVANEK
jgi:hypothetical protein